MCLDGKIENFRYKISRSSVLYFLGLILLVIIKFICSTSLPGGNQVDGLPPASSPEGNEAGF